MLPKHSGLKTRSAGGFGTPDDLKLKSCMTDQGHATDWEEAVDRIAVIDKKINEAAGTLESTNNRLRNSIVGGNTSDK